MQASIEHSVTLNGGDDLDVINVGNNGTLGAPGLLTPVVGPVIVNGGLGGADLTLKARGGCGCRLYHHSHHRDAVITCRVGGVTYSNLNSLLWPRVGLQCSNGFEYVVPTTADANAGTDTLILNPPNAITVFEQAGNYAFELGFLGGLTALDFENISLQPGNGGLNIVVMRAKEQVWAGLA